MAIKTKKVEVPDEVYEHKSENKKIEIYRDQNPIDPRSHGNLATMVCSHKKYNLGDEEPSGDHRSWSQVESQIRENNNVLALKPIYLYDHSGITVSTTPFNSHFDSMQVGLIYISQEDVENRGVKEEHRTQENYKKWLKQEVKTYDKYLTGDVWRFKLKTNDEGEELKDSCGGFYGNDKESRENLFDHAGEDMEEFEKTGGEL